MLVGVDANAVEPLVATSNIKTVNTENPASLDRKDFDSPRVRFQISCAENGDEP
jgi:hypothetical protein